MDVSDDKRKFWALKDPSGTTKLMIQLKSVKKGEPTACWLLRPNGKHVMTIRKDTGTSFSCSDLNGRVVWRAQRVQPPTKNAKRADRLMYRLEAGQPPFRTTLAEIEQDDTIHGAPVRREGGSVIQVAAGVDLLGVLAFYVAQHYIISTSEDGHGGVVEPNGLNPMTWITDLFTLECGPGCGSRPRV